MLPFIPKTAKRFLRSPSVIISEITAISVAAAASTVWPNCHFFQSVWFAALALLAAASLLVVVLEQAGRLRSQWLTCLTPSHFQTAPFRAEFERPAQYQTSDAEARPTVRIWTLRRLGLSGSGVFHTGLLLILVAGALRALLGADAEVDLMEGETLQPTATAWAAQWPGALARPVRLQVPVTLQAVKAERYDTGALRQLKLCLLVQHKDAIVTEEIAVNHDLRLGSNRLFPSSDYGPTALVEWQNTGAPLARQAALLKEAGIGRYEGIASGPGGLRAHLRTQVDSAGHHPELIEVRVMRDHGLLFAGEARVGDTLVLPGGVKLALHGTPFWARLRGSRDYALGLAYLGFALVIAGATLIFTVIKLDFCVAVTPLGDRERVFVALKPQRFAPLFQERFEQLVQAQGRRASQQAQTSPGDEAREEACSTTLSTSRLLRARLAGWLFLLLCAPLLTSCKPSALDQARTLVERYNRVVSEAYRRGDVKLIDPVVGPREGKKLTGLIGVRLDFGLTLDSRLLSLEVTDVEETKTVMRVRTKERWRYRDLRIGTGEQVGEESLDSYEMLYMFTNVNRAWLVDEIRFTKPPWVGRRQTPWTADRKGAPVVAPHGTPSEHPTP